jgi:ACS family allantoate permease-like MFS transporter
MMEALKDPKTWIFTLFAVLSHIPNSIVNQRQIIVASFGFTNLQTTLLGCVDGFVSIMGILTAITLVSRIPDSRAYVGAAFYIPPLAGVLMIEFLPWSNQIGLLFGIWMVDIGVVSFVISMAWLTSVTAGHTKRVSRGRSLNMENITELTR